MCQGETVLIEISDLHHQFIWRILSRVDIGQFQSDTSEVTLALRQFASVGTVDLKFALK